MATDLLSTPSTATVAGLLVAGLGAVYAYTQLGTSKRADTHTTGPSVDGDSHEARGTSGATRRGRKKKKGKGVGVGDGGAEGEDKGKDKVEGEGGATVAVPFPRVVPGDFEGVGESAEVDTTGTNVGSQEASPAGTASKRGNGGKTKTRRKKKTKQGKGKDRDEDKEEGSETDKEVGVPGVGRATMHGPRSGDSTDASVSLSPSVSASALGSSRAVGKGNLRVSTRLASPSLPHAQARAHAPSQPREIRTSLSFDTDGSWTHVDHHRLKTSKSTDGQARGLAEAMDVTSSDLASTASDSPVAERMEGISTDTRTARADLVQRTLAEKLVLKPRKTGVDEYVSSH